MVDTGGREDMAGYYVSAHAAVTFDKILFKRIRVLLFVEFKVLGCCSNSGGQFSMLLLAVRMVLGLFLGYLCGLGGIFW